MEYWVKTRTGWNGPLELEELVALHAKGKLPASAVVSDYDRTLTLRDLLAERDKSLTTAVDPAIAGIAAPTLNSKDKARHRLIPLRNQMSSRKFIVLSTVGVVAFVAAVTVALNVLFWPEADRPGLPSEPYPEFISGEAPKSAEELAREAELARESQRLAEIEAAAKSAADVERERLTREFEMKFESERAASRELMARLKADQESLLRRIDADGEAVSRQINEKIEAVRAEAEPEAKKFQAAFEAVRGSLFIILTMQFATNPDGSFSLIEIGEGSGWVAQNRELVTNLHCILGSDVMQGIAPSGLKPGQRFDPERVFVAAWPAGAVALLPSDREGSRRYNYEQAWVYDGVRSSVTAPLSQRRRGELRLMRVPLKSKGARPLDLVSLQLVGSEAPPAIPMLTDDQLSTLAVMEPIFVAGFPQGFLVADGVKVEPSPSRGVIRQVFSERGEFSSDASAFGGNSGGPVLNASGQVLGVLTWGLRGTETLSYCLDSSQVRVLLSYRHDPMVALRAYAIAESSPGPTVARSKQTGQSPSPAREKSGRLRDWRALQAKMTMEEVKKLLGDPDSVSETSKTLIVWNYTKKLRGTVNFKKSDRVVLSFNKPWDKVTTGSKWATYEKVLGKHDEERLIEGYFRTIPGYMADELYWDTEQYVVDEKYWVDEPYVERVWIEGYYDPVTRSWIPGRWIDRHGVRRVEKTRQVTKERPVQRIRQVWVPERKEWVSPIRIVYWDWTDEALAYVAYNVDTGEILKLDFSTK